MTKLNGKSPLGRPRRGCEYKIKLKTPDKRWWVAGIWFRTESIMELL